MAIIKKDHSARRGFLKGIASLTLQAFILSNLFFTSPAEIFAQEFPVSVSAGFPEAFLGFPAELGKFETYFQPESDSHKLFVYVIQDAHESLAAQENIFQTLDFLKQNNQLDLLLLEGAAGPLNADPLNPFKEELRNKRFLEELFRRGFVNGAVKFFGSHPRTAVSGMEDPAFYRRNIETYRFLFSQRAAVQAFLNSVEVSLIESTKRILNPKVLLYLKRWKIQQEGAEDFRDYLKFLLDYASQSLKIDWHDYSLQQDWPQLVRLFYLLNADIKQNAPEFEKEIKMLQRILGPDASLETEWLQAAAKADALSSRDFRDTAASPRHMAERLVEKAQARNVSWVRYPALTQFLSLQIFQSEILPEELFSEVQKLERKVFESLSRNPQAGASMEFYQDFYLLKRAFSLELRREQLARFREHFKGNWLPAYKRFLRKKSMPKEKTVAPLVGKVLEFYAQAESRENAFLSVLSRELSSDNVRLHVREGNVPVKHLVIVAGGYHKEGLRRAMDRLQIPYAVITPHFEAGENLLPYQKLLMGDYSEISTLGPAQLAVMPGLPEAQNMVGGAAFENFWNGLKRIKSSLELPVFFKTSPPQWRWRWRGLPKMGSLSRTLFLISMVGFLSGCAITSRDLVRQQIRADREFALPQKPAAPPQTITVNKDSLALSLLENDPVIRESGLQIEVRQAEKGRLAGSFSIRPRIGVADGKPIVSLGIGGNLPGIGSMELSGLGVDTAATAAIQLAGEIGKFWQGQDILVKAMAEQAVEIAGLDWQATFGDRYLHFLDLAYEVKTLEAQSRIAAETLKKIDAALDISLQNQQATEEERQSIRDLRSQWLLRSNDLETSLKKARIKLSVLYAPGASSETHFSIDLEYDPLPSGWKATAGQERTLRVKATGKNGPWFPANRVLAQGYATRLLAATTAQLEKKKAGFMLEAGGFSFLDSYGSNPSADFKTSINPLADQRSKDHDGFGVSGEMTFGGEVRANKKVANLNVKMAEAALETTQRNIETQISELLQIMEGYQNTIKLLEDRNAQIEAFLAKAHAESAITEDRLVRLVVEEEENRIKLLSSRREITRAIEELQVLTWDLQGLPPMFAGRSELRGGKIPSNIFVTIGTAGLAAATFGLLLILKPHLQEVSWHSFFLSLGVTVPWAGGIAAYCMWMQDHLHRGPKAFTSMDYWKDVRDAARPAVKWAMFFATYYALVGQVDFSRWINMNPRSEIVLKTGLDGLANYFIFYPRMLLGFFSGVYHAEYPGESLGMFKQRQYFDESRLKLFRRFFPVEVGAMVVNKLWSPYLSELVILSGDIAFTWMALKMIEKIHQAALQRKAALDTGVEILSLPAFHEELVETGRSEMRMTEEAEISAQELSEFWEKVATEARLRPAGFAAKLMRLESGFEAAGQNYLEKLATSFPFTFSQNQEHVMMILRLTDENKGRPLLKKMTGLFTRGPLIVPEFETPKAALPAARRNGSAGKSMKQALSGNPPLAGSKRINLTPNRVDQALAAFEKMKTQSANDGNFQEYAKESPEDEVVKFTAENRLIANVRELQATLIRENEDEKGGSPFEESLEEISKALANVFGRKKPSAWLDEILENLSKITGHEDYRKYADRNQSALLDLQPSLGIKKNEGKNFDRGIRSLSEKIERLRKILDVFRLKNENDARQQIKAFRNGEVQQAVAEFQAGKQIIRVTLKIGNKKSTSGAMTLVLSKDAGSSRAEKVFNAKSLDELRKKMLSSWNGLTEMMDRYKSQEIIKMISNDTSLSEKIPVSKMPVASSTDASPRSEIRNVEALREMVSIPASQIKSRHFSLLRLWREQTAFKFVRDTSTDLMADDHLFLYKAGPFLGAFCLPVLFGVAVVVTILFVGTERTIEIFKKTDPIFVGAFSLLVGTFFARVGYSFSEDHLKDMEIAQFVVRNTKKYLQGPSKAEIDTSFFEAVQKFEQDTGFKVAWTDHPDLLIKLDRKNRTLIMAIGWIIQSEIPGNRGCLAYLKKRLHNIQLILKHHPIDRPETTGFWRRVSAPRNAEFLHVMTGTVPSGLTVAQQRSEIRADFSNRTGIHFLSKMTAGFLLGIFLMVSSALAQTNGFTVSKLVGKQMAVENVKGAALLMRGIRSSTETFSGKDLEGAKFLKTERTGIWTLRKETQNPYEATYVVVPHRQGYFRIVSLKGNSQSVSSAPANDHNGHSVKEILLGQSGEDQAERTPFKSVASVQSVGAETATAAVSSFVPDQEPVLSPLTEVAKNVPASTDLGAAHPDISPATQPLPENAVVAPASEQIQDSQDHEPISSTPPSDISSATLYKGSGQAVVNPPQPITLKAPFPADKMSFSVKPGDVVEKGDPLAKGIDTERENRMQFLKSRTHELQGLIGNRRKNPGTLDRDTAFRYQFEQTELELELGRLTAEQESDILLAPQAAVIQTLPQGPATDGSMTVQIVPLNEGIITLPLSMEHFGFDDVMLSVNGKRVTVSDWEAGGFDLAKGAKGEFNLTVHFISSEPVTQGREKLCKYDVTLIRSNASGNDPLNIQNAADFHTTVPPSQFVRAGVPSVPGVPAGIFHAAVHDGQIVKAGDILGTVRIPAVHEEQTRQADELVRLAKKCRSYNAQFPTLPESAVQEFESRAQRAKASVEREGAAVLVKAPVGGRVRGVTSLDGQVLATGRITEAGILNAEVFLGSSTDPRSTEWSDRLSNDDPYLIPVEKGSVKKRDKVSVSTARGILPGEVYAVIPLANRGVQLYSGLDGIVIKITDEGGFVGEGGAVNIGFDNGKLASKWTLEKGVSAQKFAPPLRVQNDIPPAIQQEFQKHPGKRIGVFRILEMVRSEKNVHQRFEIARYFMNPLGFRYVNGLVAAVIAGLFGLWSLPKLFFVAIRHRRQKAFFRKDTEEALAELNNQFQEIEMRLTRRANRRQGDPARDPDAQVLREIIVPIQNWVKLVWEHEDLGSDERDTITTQASELATNPLFRFSKEHFEELAGIWKNDTRYLVKIRGLLARMSLLTGQVAGRQLRAHLENGEDMETLELLRFQEKMADFSENFNEGYNLAHRLIALSQVIDLFPPKLKRGNHDLEFSAWQEIIRNRRVIWTFPVLRFFLFVSAMVVINQWIALRSFKNVAVNMQKLGISGFPSTQEAMRTAKEGLRKAFHPVANVDELEGNKLDAYYGRWLGRLMVVVGVLIAIKLPVFLALLGLSHLIAPGAALFLQFAVPAVVIWRHVGPMLEKLNGEGYGAVRAEIQTLRRSAEKMRRKPPAIRNASTPKAFPQVSSRVVNPPDEDLMMEKMRQALLDDDLRQSVEIIVLLSPKHGENKKFFEAMTTQDEVLKRFDFTVAESDGLFPGNVGQFFAARDLTKFLGKKTQIYWFPQPDTPFPAAMALFKMNLAEALRMAGDFKQHKMKFGEILFPGGDLSNNTINYTKNGSHIVIGARLASLEEVKKHRYPVMLGRNGSPRHDVEHVVRRPEDLQGVLSQYGHQLGAGLSMENPITPQFPVFRGGPLALVSDNDEEREQMEELLMEFRKKIENLTERYGPFPVDLLEDFASVVVEFRRQILENDAVPPNLQSMAHRQKMFANVDDTANPYGKIYGALGKTLWNRYRNQQQNPPEVEAFVPAPSDHLFVSGNDREGIKRWIERIRSTFPELVNAVASEKFNSGKVSDIQSQKFVFSDSKNDNMPLTKEAGYQRNLASRKVAAFVTKDGKILFQRRSRQSSINPGLLDLAVFERLEPGETPEAAIQRGFLEELRDGRPLPDSFSPLSVMEIDRVSYQVPHEKRRQVPSTRREDVSVFLLSLNGEFGWNEFVPGEDAVEVVSYPLSEVWRMYDEKHGVFTPRTYTLMKKFLPEIGKTAALAGHEGTARSELRKWKIPAKIPPGHESRGIAEHPPLQEKPLLEARDFIPEKVRLLTAIKITERILGPQDEKLFSRLKALLENEDLLFERTEPELRAILELSARQLLQLQKNEEMFRAIPQQANTANTLFIDARIGIREEHILLLSRLPFRVVILFDSSQFSRRVAIEQKIKGMVLPARRFQLMDTPDGISASILKYLRPLITGAQYQRSDYAFVGTDRREVQKVKGYVGNLVYYDKDLKAYGEEVLFSLLWHLVTSPQLFGLGKKRDICWGIKEAVVYVLERLAESLQAIQKTGQAA